MLDNQHRAVYRVHHALLAQLGERRVYYVVGLDNEADADVRVIPCEPNCSKSVLPTGNLNNVRCFTACGTEIKPLNDMRGRYDSSKSFAQHHVEFRPLPAAA